MRTDDVFLPMFSLFVYVNGINMLHLSYIYSYVFTWRGKRLPLFFHVKLEKKYISYDHWGLDHF